MSIFPKFFFTLFGNAPLPSWLRSFIARVEGDGGTVVDRNHTKEVYADVIDYEPSLIQSCDSGKAGTLYSIIPSRDLLLYQYTGAAAAYSLRQLSAGTVYVVKVRRSGDNAELDFTASQVSDGALAAWVRAGGGTEDGLVTTWYDQSGNTNNATQAAAANQPKIVSSGTLVTENGKAALEFDATSDHFGFASGLFVNEHSIFAVVQQNNLAGAIIAVSGSGGYYFRYTGSAPASLTWYIPDTTNSVLAFTAASANQELITAIKDNSNVYGYINGGNERSRPSTGNLTSTPTAIGRYAASNYFGGSIQEIILYASAQSANRTGIEANINDYYNIYP